jgi:hypothetical protein
MTVTASQVAQLQGAITTEFTAGGTVTNGNAVYIDSSSNVQNAKADAAATSEGIGIVVAVPQAGQTTAASTERVTVVTFGPVGGYASLTPGVVYYIDAATAGAITATAPTGAGKWAKTIGYAKSATELFVLPGIRPAISSAGA